MSVRQLEHSEINNEQKKFPICVICDGITSAENVGMIFRISEAMGVPFIYLCGSTPTPVHKKVLKTARSTVKNIPYQYEPNIISVIHTLRKEGYTIAALEVTSASHPLSEFDFKPFPKVAVIIGNEQNGVQEEVLRLTDVAIAIKMYGQNTSINVVHSLSIALYEITRQIADLS